jgi:hypothetical protein
VSSGGRRPRRAGGLAERETEFLLLEPQRIVEALELGVELGEVW